MIINNTYDEAISDWIIKEFGNLAISCGRTIKRFIKTMETLSRKPDSSIAAASENIAEAKAIYRLLGDENLTNEVVLSSHRKQTIMEIKDSGTQTILCVQDTSDIDYTNLKATTGLGEYGGDVNSRGLKLHTTIALTTDGIMTGILDQKIWVRDPEDRGKRHTRQTRPIEEKESYKWLEAMERSNKGIPSDIRVINICDREADLFEFFYKAISEEKLFLVRAMHNRKSTDELKIFDQIQALEATGNILIEIPRDTRNNRPKRTADIELRHLKVEIPVPVKVRKYYSNKEPLKVNLILAQEINVPEGIEPIQWYLVTNVDIESFEDILEKIKWYVQRWKIERFHYILKSGCKIEKLQSDDAERLKKLILMYSIIAARILCLTYYAREMPQASCDIMFDEEEWTVLYRIANKTSKCPPIAPTMKEAVAYLAKLGGFLGRKGDGEPGVEVIWRGLRELSTVLQYYKHLTP